MFVLFIIKRKSLLHFVSLYQLKRENYCFFLRVLPREYLLLRRLTEAAYNVSF